MRTFVLALALVCTCVMCWGSDWLAEGGDPGRTGWQRDETILNTSNVKGLKLLWKTHVDSTPREMHNLFPPVIVQRVNTDSGPKQIAVVAGVSDDLFGIDVSEGEQIWHTHFDSTYTPPANGRGRGGNTLCPGGQDAAPVVAATDTPGKYTLYTVSWDGRLRQINVADGKDAAPPEKFMPPNGKPWALNLFDGAIYTAVSQGCGGVWNGFYSFDLSTKKASVFFPAGGGLWGRRGAAVAPDGTAYMGTGDGPFNAETKNLGDAIVALKLDANKQLQLAGFYGPPDANWMWHRDLDINVTPMVFDYKGRHFLVGTGKQCRLYLLDRDNFGGSDHRTALYRSPLVCNDSQTWDAEGAWGAMATWQDSSGTQWVLLPFWGPVSKDFHAPIESGRPTNGGVAAFKLEEKGGKWQLMPAWLSHDMDMAEEVIVANGVVYAYGSGEDTHQRLADRAWNETPGTPAPTAPTAGGSARRIADSTHATLFALDGQSGKELWSSGDQITSWNHSSGISIANGRVYIPTFDGNVYCFGIVRQQ
jgi:hypothetical protein